MEVASSLQVAWPQPLVLISLETPPCVKWYTTLSGSVGSPLTPGGRAKRISDDIAVSQYLSVFHVGPHGPATFNLASHDFIQAGGVRFGFPSSAPGQSVRFEIIPLLGSLDLAVC
jgi:hypothetical protein